jgi:hypothetical protein
MGAELDLSPVLTGKLLPVTQLYLCGGMSNDSTRHCRRKDHDCHGLYYVLRTLHLSKLQPSIVTGGISPACGIFVFHSSCLCTPKFLDLRVKAQGMAIEVDTLYQYLTSFAWQHSFPHHSPVSWLFPITCMKYCCRIICSLWSKHRGVHMVIGDSELGGDVVKAFACMAQNWRNAVIEPD